jgi:glycine cleavage system H protein
MSNLPEELKYTKEHEWVLLGEDGVVTVGITDFAQQELGELVYVEVDTVGETIEIGEVFGTVEAVKTTSDLFMPITGEILEFNPNLDEDEGDDPTLINSDPYGEGWIVKIKVSDESSEEDLLSASDYKELIEG